MSAIFGIIDFKGRPLRDECIASMQADLAHRGPDGQGLYREESVAMGHMLLQVTPESVYDSSPYEEDGFVITANARLDEREAIMERLGIEGSDRDTITDPLLLLRSFRKYGKGFVKDIYGDFAFAIWDKQRRELFCARDQIGVKPLLYYYQAGRFVFSSELKSIVKLQLPDIKIYQKRFDELIFGLNADPFATAWKRIMRLPPASSLLIVNHRIEETRYWLPKVIKSSRLRTEEESAALLKEIIFKVISDHTRGLNNVGVPLSGGLDSSVIACVSEKILSERGGKITTVSEILGPSYIDSDQSDEKSYINSVLQKLNRVDSEFVYHEDYQYFSHLNEKFDKHFDTFTAAYYVDEALFNCLKEKQVRRVLSGYLGDTTASNSSIKPLPYLLVNFKLAKLISLFKRINKNSGFKTFGILKTVIAELFPVLTFRINRLKHKHKPPWDISTLPLSLNYGEKKHLTESRKRKYRNRLIRRSDIVKLIYDPANELFEENWDCASSYHNIEITYPFLDRRIIEFLYSVPVEHFMAMGVRRGLIRLAMKDLLPQPVIERLTKGSYSPNHHDIMKNDIQQLKLLIERDELRNIINNKIDIELVKIQIDEFAKSRNSREFLHNYWEFIYICHWISFNIWYLKLIKMKNKASKKTWSKPIVKSALPINKTLSRGGKGGDGGPNINQTRS